MLACSQSMRELNNLVIMRIFVNSILVIIMCGQEVLCVNKKRLENKHLVIEGQYWFPYLFWKCPDQRYDWWEDCPHNRTYDGVMWHLLLFMQRARNFTFTLVQQAEDYEWGTCFAINNCTGMIGVVNRGEVDLALGCNFSCKLFLVKSSGVKF